MGSETEYGISVPGHPNANAMLTSSQIVNAYATAMQRARRARWDFEEENPLRDARGFDLARELADASQLTDEDSGLANVILTNGARLYVDHAHPEYSTPEVTNPRDAVIWDKAGELIMAEAARYAALVPGSLPINLYKNNTDNKGASYGSHENYLVSRSTPFADIVRHLTPFFVTRQVFAGAGRVGIGQDGRGHGFQISQRADFFEVEVGLETTLKRPIINTRDEPHADPEKHRRLHVIIGDANLAEISIFLKMGTTSLVLAMIEDRFIGADFTVDQPVRTLHEVSHDPSLKHLVQAALRPQADGRSAADGVLRAGPQVRRGPLRHRRGPGHPGGARPLGVGAHPARGRPDAAAAASWTGSPSWSCSRATATRDNLDWDDARLHLVDLQYSDVRPDKGLYQRLAARGRFERIVTRRGDPGRGGPAAGGHPRVLPRPLPGQVRRLGGRRVLGLGHLRPARARVAPADPHPRSAARHQAACAGADRAQQDGQRPGARADDGELNERGPRAPARPPSRAGALGPIGAARRPARLGGNAGWVTIARGLGPGRTAERVNAPAAGEG